MAARRTGQGSTEQGKDTARQEEIQQGRIHHKAVHGRAERVVDKAVCLLHAVT